MENSAIPTPAGLKARLDELAANKAVEIKHAHQDRQRDVANALYERGVFDKKTEGHSTSLVDVTLVEFSFITKELLTIGCKCGDGFTGYRDEAERWWLDHIKKYRKPFVRPAHLTTRPFADNPELAKLAEENKRAQVKRNHPSNHRRNKKR